METLRIACGLIFLLVVHPHIGLGGESSQGERLDALYKSVCQLTEKHFPDISSHKFQNHIHFENSTQLFIEPAIVKTVGVADPPLEEVRGPKTDGVWCRIELREGDTPYARSAGRTPREQFDEYVFYPYARDLDQHLYVILRLPKDDGKSRHKAILKDLEAILKNFAPDESEGN